ncbi:MULTISPECIES: DUF2271 domain-containing protein [unclassified Bosea (in: a-proteobacteria)]|uniref:DUF2271 domain-containing protein n=1 Tax=unclassified Bosea (in: a-proteobacteria) TaxID=2653178 RepID=UPI000953A4A2|nr:MULTISPECIES: DUF2271 domain-containing protein [unclassified Bosea (in: a-proteobacteria)]SIR51068.1 Predicted protein [Bosea sp. TND4EK4]
MRRLARALALALPLGLAGALAHSAAAEARPVRITTTLKPYGGDGAYLAIYITDPLGKLHKTVRIAGGKAKYYKHLSAWNRLSGGRIDGTTGASVGSGQSLSVSVDIADALIDAGYQIRVDSAVENENDVPGDAVAPLTTSGAGKPVAGRGYVKSLTFDM